MLPNPLSPLPIGRQIANYLSPDPFLKPPPPPLPTKPYMGVNGQMYRRPYQPYEFIPPLEPGWSGP